MKIEEAERIFLVCARNEGTFDDIMHFSEAATILAAEYMNYDPQSEILSLYAFHSEHTDHTLKNTVCTNPSDAQLNSNRAVFWKTGTKKQLLEEANSELKGLGVPSKDMIDSFEFLCNVITYLTKL